MKKSDLTNLVHDPKRLYESLGIETGVVATQVHTLLLPTAAELCRAAEQARASAQSAKAYSAAISASTDEARYGAAAILLVVAALEGAIHTAAAIVGEKFRDELPALEFGLPKGKKKRVVPRKLPSEKGISLEAKWRDIPPQLTTPPFVSASPDGPAQQLEFPDGSQELEQLSNVVETRNELLQHHHAEAQALPLGTIRAISQNDATDHMPALHSTERYDAVAARRACILAADLISPLHERLGLRGFWWDGLEQALRGTAATLDTGEPPDTDARGRQAFHSDSGGIVATAPGESPSSTNSEGG